MENRSDLEMTEASVSSMDLRGSDVDHFARGVDPFAFGRERISNLEPLCEDAEENLPLRDDFVKRSVCDDLVGSSSVLRAVVGRVASQGSGGLP